MVITSVPVTLTEQGIYCLKGNLATSDPGIIAILIGANNVTIDFNGYKLGGQSAGAGTAAVGVTATDRLNVQIRNGTIRGFRRGVEITNGSGHLVEEMVLDANTEFGVALQGAGQSVVRGNRVLNTGASAVANDSIGIYVAQGAGNRILDNDVANTVQNASQVSNAHGIFVSSGQSVIDGNRVTDSATHGIRVKAGHVSITRNEVHNGTIGSQGISSEIPSTICRGNTVSGFTTTVACDIDGGGNVSAP
jgi:hypothetical protein